MPPWDAKRVPLRRKGKPKQVKGIPELGGRCLDEFGGRRLTKYTIGTIRHCKFYFWKERDILSFELFASVRT